MMLENDTFVDMTDYASGHGLMNARSAQKSGFQPPAGTRVISADNHFVLAADIWHDGFPQHLKDKAPRVWRDDQLGFPRRKDAFNSMWFQSNADKVLWLN